MRWTLTLLSLLTYACATPCAERSISECSQDDECSAIRGKPVNARSMCLDETQPAACSERVEICDTSITLARDPAGDLWWFSNGCIPDGWAEDHDAGAKSWEACAPR